MRKFLLEDGHQNVVVSQRELSNRTAANTYKEQHTNLKTLTMMLRKTGNMNMKRKRSLTAQATGITTQVVSDSSNQMMPEVQKKGFNYEYKDEMEEKEQSHYGSYMNYAIPKQSSDRKIVHRNSKNHYKSLSQLNTKMPYLTDRQPLNNQRIYANSSIANDLEAALTALVPDDNIKVYENLNIDNAHHALTKNNSRSQRYQANSFRTTSQNFKPGQIKDSNRTFSNLFPVSQISEQDTDDNKTNSLKHILDFQQNSHQKSQRNINSIVQKERLKFNDGCSSNMSINIKDQLQHKIARSNQASRYKSSTHIREQYLPNPKAMIDTERSISSEEDQEHPMIQAQKKIQLFDTNQNYTYSNVQTRQKLSQRQFHVDKINSRNINAQTGRVEPGKFQNQQPHEKKRVRYQSVEDHQELNSSMASTITIGGKPDTKVQNPNYMKQICNQLLSASEEHEYWTEIFDKNMRKHHLSLHQKKAFEADRDINRNQYQYMDPKIVSQLMKKQREKKTSIQSEVRETKNHFDRFMSNQFIYQAFQRRESDVDRNGHYTKTARGLQEIPEAFMRAERPDDQCGMRITRVRDKCDEVTDTVMESFYHDQYQASLEPSQSEEYHRQLFRETQLKDMGALAMYLAQKIKASDPAMSQMNTEKPNLPLQELMKNQLTLKQRVEAIKAQEKSKAKLMSLFGNKFKVVGAKNKMINNIKKETVKQMMEKRLKHQLHLQQLKKVDSYKSTLKHKKEEKDKEIRENQQMIALLYNPSLSNDLNIVVDDNIEMLLRQSDTFNHVQNNFKKKKEMDAIKQTAQKLTDSLQEKVEMQKNLAEVKRMQGMQVGQAMVGNKVEYLVLKFITNLRKAVSKRKDENIQRSNEQFIKTILKKNDYVDQFKKAVPKVQQKSKKLYGKRPLVQKQSEKLGQDGKERDKEKMKQALKNMTNNWSQKVMEMQQLQAQVENIPSVVNEVVRVEEAEDSDDSNDNFEQGDFKNDIVKKKILADYIQSSIERGEQPLPILHRIGYDGSLPLVSYQMNETNMKSFLSSLPHIIPNLLKKLYFVNNASTDSQIMSLIIELSKTSELKTLVLMSNQFSSFTYRALADYMIPSQMFKSINKFVLKDPNPFKLQFKDLLKVTYQLNNVSQMLPKLNKLCLSRLGFDNSCLVELAQAVVNLPFLEHLDISANGIDAPSFCNFFDTIDKQNQLRSLNISFNNCSKSGTSLKVKIADFLHYSSSLIHFDMGNLSLKFQDYKHIIERGVRKSKTLLAIHLSGMGLQQHEILQMRRSINVYRSQIPNLIQDEVLESQYEVAKVNMLKLNLIFLKQEKFNSQQLFGEGVARQDDNKTSKVKKAIKVPIQKNDGGDEILYQRILGHSEIINSHRWVEHAGPHCQICNKNTYCVFIWNKQLKSKNKHSRFFTSIQEEPVRFQIPNYNAPVITMKGRTQIFPMIRLVEFIDRLQNEQIQSGTRSCDNEIEMAAFLKVQHAIYQKMALKNDVDPTYYKHMRDTIGSKHQSQSLQELMHDWPTKLLRLMPPNAHQVVNIKEYAQLLQNENQDMEQIANETFMCAVILPESDSKPLYVPQFAIKHDQIPGIDILRQNIPNLKHMSVNTVPLTQKCIKKVKAIRHFQKATSVFASWREDTEKTLDVCLETDSQQGRMKLTRFLKDEVEYANTMKVLRKYYAKLKNQFLTRIACLKSYPTIDWLDFVTMCQDWGIIDDKTLTKTDVDRIFITANFEEVDDAVNDDNALCRFEFFECIVRMAKTKYFDKGTRPSVSHSVESMIVDYLLPNTIETMENQKFRADMLYNLDVDDLFKKNKEAIDVLFKKGALKPKQKPRKAYSKEDAVELVSQASKYQIQGVNTSVLEFQESSTMLAYSLSRMTIQNELTDYQKYSEMCMVEFYEFLGRLAELTYSELKVPLVEKLSKLLTILLFGIKPQFKPLIGDADIESDSDYDDDIVTQVLQERFGGNI